MKPSQYLFAWFSKVFDSEERHTIVPPGEDLPHSFDCEPKRAGDFEIYAMNGGPPIQPRQVRDLMPVEGIQHARLIVVEEGGPTIQEMIFELDGGRRFCVQRMVINLGDLVMDEEVLPPGFAAMMAEVGEADGPYEAEEAE